MTQAPSDAGRDCGSGWQQQLAEGIRDPLRLLRAAGVPRDALAFVLPVHRTWPCLVTPYYLALARGGWPEDPILRQCVPAPEEAAAGTEAHTDPLAEERDSPVPHLVHRYPDRVLLLVTGRCAVHCRHCLRKRRWGEPALADDSGALERALAYIAATTTIREVILSGGDPLVLPDDTVADLLGRVRAIPHIEVIRIGTRLPVVLPQRITPELCAILDRCGPIWLATHFNHPWELTSAAETAVERLLRAAVPVVNQTVLLRGVNDSAATLRRLFRGLLRLRVKPYCLYHGDPVRGTMHLRTGTVPGLDLLRELQDSMSGLAVPHFALDLPDGGGKVRLEPDRCDATRRRRDATPADAPLRYRGFRGTDHTYPEP